MVPSGKSATETRLAYQMPDIGEKTMEQKTLRDWRKERNLTQIQLAVLSNVSLSTIADFETGRHLLTIESAIKLVNALGITLNDVKWIVDNGDKSNASK